MSGESNPNRSNLHSMSSKELRKLATYLDIPKRSKLRTKDALIEAITQHVNENSDENAQDNSSPQGNATRVVSVVENADFNGNGDGSNDATLNRSNASGFRNQGTAIEVEEADVFVNERSRQSDVTVGATTFSWQLVVSVLTLIVAVLGLLARYHLAGYGTKVVPNAEKVIVDNISFYPSANLATNFDSQNSATYRQLVDNIARAIADQFPLAKSIYVYPIADGSVVDVGMANDIRNRLKELGISLGQKSPTKVFGRRHFINANQQIFVINGFSSDSRFTQFFKLSQQNLDAVIRAKATEGAPITTDGPSLTASGMSNARVTIIQGGGRVNILKSGNVPTLSLAKNENFQIVVENNNEYDIAALVRVDGLSRFAFADAEEDREGMWDLIPGKRNGTPGKRVFSGWFKNANSVNAYEVGLLSDADGLLAPLSLGTIEIAFAATAIGDLDFPKGEPPNPKGFGVVEGLTLFDAVEVIEQRVGNIRAVARLTYNIDVEENDEP